MSSSKSTVLVNLATTFEPLPGAEPIVKVVPETVKSSIGCNFLPSFLIANKCTLDGEPDKVNAVVDPSPVSISVDDTVGLFNLLDMAKELILFKSTIGDKLALEDLAYNVCGNKAATEWTDIFKDIKNYNVYF